MARKIIRGSGSMSLEEALNNPSYSNSYSVESATLDPAMGQEVADVLTDNLPDNGFYFLGQAEVCAKEAWEWGNECQRLINERNQQIKTCKTLASSRGGEALSYWKAMSTEGVGDFIKKVWETIKNVIKKLILMVINFIKSVGNFIKGAMAKAQELFFKKYQREILDRIDKSTGNVKIKMVGASPEKVCNINPIELFKVCVTGSIVASGILNSSIMLIPNEIGQGIRDIEALKKRILNEIKRAQKSQMDPMINVAKDLKAFYDKVVSQENKSFPSASAIINSAVYGNDKPSKYEYKCEDVVNDYKDVLGGAVLTILANGMKAGKAANKSLSNGLKVIEKIEKSEASVIKDKTERKEAKENVGNKLTGLIRDWQRSCQFTTTLLLHLYGVSLSFRMKVFSAARKLIKKGDSNKGRTKKDSGFGRTAIQEN